MSLATSHKGHVLLSFNRDGLMTPSEDDASIPIPFALVVALHNKQVLFVYNHWREIWELPGGMIDEEESASVAAKRELQEETAQIADSLTPIGLAKMRLKPDDRLEFGAIFTTELQTLQPFQVNDEAIEIQWLDVAQPRPDNVNAIDYKIAEMVSASLNQ